MTTDQAVAPPPAGLRERKKQRTRAALVRSALELFTRNGYDHTTVDEIADAVEVSQRTFFRYFANKEEVAFATQDVVERHFFDALAGRPADEAPLTALRGAVQTSWSTVGEIIAELVPHDLHMRMYCVIESTPALLAVHLRRIAELEDRLAREIARREGLGVDTDPRPRLVVGAFGGAIRVAGRLWNEGEGTSMESLRDLTLFQLDHLEAAVAEQWDR